MYGLTTGVGAMKRVAVGADEQADFNRLLLLSHRTGTGADVRGAVVRATLLAQLAGFARGRSGVRESLADLLVAALNAGLAPRAHARWGRWASQTWARWPTSPRRSPAPGSGPPSSTGWASSRGGPTPRRRLRSSTRTRSPWAAAALALAAIDRLLVSFDQAAALTFEGMLGNVEALDPAVAEARPVPGLEQSIERLRALLANGKLLEGGLHRELQDPLTMRVVPQTHAAGRVAFGHARTLVESELVSSHDNPCITPDGRALSNGNFDSVPYGVALDYLRLALAHVATASCERSQKLVHSAFSGLPTGLRERRWLERRRTCDRRLRRRRGGRRGAAAGDAGDARVAHQLDRRGHRGSRDPDSRGARRLHELTRACARTSPPPRCTAPPRRSISANGWGSSAPALALAYDSSARPCHGIATASRRRPISHRW